MTTKPKILFVNAGLEDGGGLTHIILLLTKLRSLGYQADLLVFSDGPVAAAARQANIPVQSLASTGRLDLHLKNRLYQAIQQGGYTIVHTHGPRANLYASLLAKRLKRAQITWAITVHSDPYLDFMNRGLAGKLFTTLNLHALKKAPGIFAVSDRFTQIIHDRVGVPTTRIQTIYNGLDFRPTTTFATQPHQTFNLIDVARLTPVKDHALLLNAFKAAQLENAHLYVVGDGELRATITQQIQDLGLSQQVTLTGFYDHQELDHLYQRMDLAVLSSRSESFPLVILEAAEHSLPVLTTAVGDVAKMVTPEQTGWIVPVGDVAAFSTKLQLAAQKFADGELAVMGAAMRRDASAHFSLDRQAQQVLQGYHNFQQHV
ncbi:glycosyltransferase family 4 protein [Lapidilactobacillus salsurivasis]